MSKKIPWWRKAANAVVAAFTSPEVVKAEKSLAVLIAVRVALAAGASVGVVKIIQDFWSL